MYLSILLDKIVVALDVVQYTSSNHLQIHRFKSVRLALAAVFRVAIK